MRKTFAEEISKYDVTVISADLGFGLWGENQKIINVGASEQSMMGAGIGYALEGKKAVCYSITPFLLYRPFEWLRYIDRHNLPVILAASGRNRDYAHDGHSHWGEDDEEILQALPNIIKNSHWPLTKEEIPNLVKMAVESSEPFYINLKR